MTFSTSTHSRVVKNDINRDNLMKTGLAIRKQRIIRVLPIYCLWETIDLDWRTACPTTFLDPIWMFEAVFNIYALSGCQKWYQARQSDENRLSFRQTKDHTCVLYNTPRECRAISMRVSRRTAFFWTLSICTCHVDIDNGQKCENLALIDWDTIDYCINQPFLDMVRCATRGYLAISQWDFGRIACLWTLSTPTHCVNVDYIHKFAIWSEAFGPDSWER